MAASIVMGFDAEARHAAGVEREQSLEAVTDTASEEARGKVARLLQVEVDFSERRVAAAAELEVLNRTAGDTLIDAVLKGEGPGAATRLNGQIAKLRVEVETADSAIGSAREKRQRAIREVFKVQAEALRALAAPLLAAAESEAAVTDELLTEFERRKGVRPAFDGPSTSGRGVGAATREFQVLKEVALLEEASDLERRATMREGTRPRAYGTAQADSLEELLAKVHADPMILGPRAVDVMTWADRVEAEERDRRRKVELAGGTSASGYIAPAAAVRLRLAWAEGRIDLAESGVVRTGPTVEEVLTAEQQDRLVEQRADLVDRARRWLEQHGGDLRKAVARAEATGLREGVAARSWAAILQAEGLGVVEVEGPGHPDADLDGDAEAIG